MIPDDRGVRPRCKCHDLPKGWVKDKRAADLSGGYWVCAVEIKARADRGNATPASKARRKRYREKLKAEGRCANGCGREVRPGYVQCRECVIFRNTDPATVRRRVEATNRQRTKERTDRIASAKAEIEAIQKRIRDAN